MEDLMVDERVALEPTAHAEVEFVEFGLLGRETLRSGHVWGPAPMIGGMKCFWVIPAGPSHLAVAVVAASRRHRVGIETERAQGRLWRARGGRYVDKGTWYTETHPCSPTGALTAQQRGPATPPSRIEVPPLDPGVFAALSGEPDPGLLQ